MRLEAVDRKNPHLVCVATIAQIDKARPDCVLIHFDGWTETCVDSHFSILFARFYLICTFLLPFFFLATVCYSLGASLLFSFFWTLLLFLSSFLSLSLCLFISFSLSLSLSFSLSLSLSLSCLSFFRFSRQIWLLGRAVIWWFAPARMVFAQRKRATETKGPRGTI